MKKEVLFVLFDKFADWEGAYIAPNLNSGIEPGRTSKYIVKTVSLMKDLVVSIGGFNVLPDYDINDMYGFLDQVKHTRNGFAALKFTREILCFTNEYSRKDRRKLLLEQKRIFED